MSALQLIKVAIGLLLATVMASPWIRRPDRRKQWLLCYTSVGLALLIAEVLLRQFHPQYDGHNDLFEPDPRLGWRFVPGQSTSVAWAREASHYVAINESGFRDAGFTRNAGKTILCFGDSFVSNLAVQDEEVFTRLMEQDLTDTRVLNLGVNGYGQTQEALLMQEQLDRFEADLAIVVIYLRNDFTDNVNSSWIYPRPITTETTQDEFVIAAPDPANRKTSSIWHSLTRSHVLSLANHTINDLAYRWESDSSGFRPSERTPPELYLCAQDPWEGTEHLHAAMQHLLLSINEECQNRDVPLLFVLAPTMFQVNAQLWSQMLAHYGEDSSDYSPSLPNQKLLQFASTHQLQMLDLLPSLRQASEAGDRLYHHKEQHWNPRGNAFVAEQITLYLRSRGWPNNLQTDSRVNAAPENQ